MLITRPNHDITTNYLCVWSEFVVNCAKGLKKEVIDLFSKRANYNEFHSIIKKVKPKFLFLNGHGNDETVTGFDNEPILEASKDLEILFGRIVYARSCRSAKKLGKMSIKNGCEAYLGYDEDFVFMIDDDFVMKPEKDKIAEMFIKPSNQVAVSIVKGNSVGEADKKSKELLKKNIQQLMLSTVPKWQKDLIPYLLWNYNHQVCLGDQNARL